MPALYENKPVRYIAAEKLWADNTIYDAGVEFSYDGRPTPSMLPICDEGVKRSAEARAWEKAPHPLPENEHVDVLVAEARAAAEAKAAARLKKGKAKQEESELA